MMILKDNSAVFVNVETMTANQMRLFTKIRFSRVQNVFFIEFAHDLPHTFLACLDNKEQAGVWFVVVAQRMQHGWNDGGGCDNGQLRPGREKFSHLGIFTKGSQQSGSLH